MSSPLFTLSVPADERFRVLAVDVVRAYLRLPDRKDRLDAETLVASVAAAVDRLAAHGDDVEVLVVANDSGVEIRLTCGGRSESIHAPVQHPDAH